MKLAIFHLVMYLEAVYEEGKQHVLRALVTLDQEIPSVFWYERALLCIESGARSLSIRPFSSMQNLLSVHIYSMYSPVASPQWQLFGIAMRIVSTIRAQFLTDVLQISVELGLLSLSSYLRRQDTKEAGV